jgi:hypothetical protein
MGMIRLSRSGTLPFIFIYPQSGTASFAKAIKKHRYHNSP